MAYPFTQARNYTRGRIRPVQLIIVHSMEAAEKGNTAESIARYFATTNVKASAHLCIDNDSIIQCVRFEDTAWHCKNANANGIGIEHAGYARQTRDEWLNEYGKAMLELSAKAAAALCKQFGVPAQRARFLSGVSPTVTAPGLCGHVDVPAHGSHYDPGPHFPWDYYLALVASYVV